MAKTGLVLEGGAMRGIYTAGVLDVFIENNIYFDTTIGVSAGACFGCNLLSKQKGRALRYNLRFCKDKRYCSFRELFKSGDIYGYEFCYHTIPEELDVFDRETFMSNPGDFVVVATDLVTGKPVYKTLKNLDRTDMEWVRASASMPIVSNTVKIDSGYFLDGGCSDSIPLKHALDVGCKKTVVVLTRPDGYVKKKEPLLPIERIKYRKFPAFVNTLAHRHETYMDELRLVENEAAKGNIFLIRPSSMPPADRIEHDPNKLQKTYNLGVMDAKRLLPELKKYLEK